MKFRRNPAAQRLLTESQEMRVGLSKIAEQIADKTRGNAPVRRGDFKRSIRADGPRVESSDPFAHLIEFGSKNNPAYAPFRRGVKDAGCRLDDQK